jgi:3-oxoadipate enol-lactonase
MPAIDAEGCPLHVEVAGRSDAPVLMLSNSLGTDLHMWDAQAPAFAARFRLVRYDRRGHGKSGAPKGPYSMERLARDALAVMDGLGLRKVHWLGLSMGGMEGQWLGANAPERIDRLILSNTAPHYADKSMWDNRIRAVRAGGLAAIADAVLNVWFTKDFQARAPQIVARMKAMMLATPVEGYIGCCEAIRDMDHRALLAKISAPTLIVAGRHDPATNVDIAQSMRGQIRGASVAIVEAAHIANVEQPDAYTDEVLKFLSQR